MARTREELQAAVNLLNILSADEEVRMLADEKDFERMDRNSELREERELGMAEGLAESRAESQRKIAKNMLEEKIDIEVIIKITGLTKEEIEKL